MSLMTVSFLDISCLNMLIQINNTYFLQLNVKYLLGPSSTFLPSSKMSLMTRKRMLIFWMKTCSLFGTVSTIKILM
jgi:hypothetical protein